MTIQLVPVGLVGEDAAEVFQAHLQPLHPRAEEAESPRADFGAGGAAAALVSITVIRIRRSGTCCAGGGISCLTSSTKKTSGVQSLPRLLRSVGHDMRYKSMPLLMDGWESTPS